MVVPSGCSTMEDRVRFGVNGRLCNRVLCLFGSQSFQAETTLFLDEVATSIHLLIEAAYCYVKKPWKAGDVGSSPIPIEAASMAQFLAEGGTTDICYLRCSGGFARAGGGQVGTCGVWEKKATPEWLCHGSGSYMVRISGM